LDQKKHNLNNNNNYELCHKLTKYMIEINTSTLIIAALSHS